MEIGILGIAGGFITALLAVVIGFCFRCHQRRQALLLEQRLLQQRLEQCSADRDQQLQSLRSLQAEYQQLQVSLASTREALQQQAHWRTSYETLIQELNHLKTLQAAQQAERREIEVRFEESQRAAAQQQQLLLTSEQRLSSQFENLAHRIFAQSNRQVEEQNRLGLDKLLIPLKEQLDGFRRQVQESFGQEARERHTLVHEIHQLQQLNLRMAQDAVNLTQALKGNNKTQGNWGEVVLSRVLEASGLREGHEYQTQVSVAVDSAQRLQPDVIVRLPQNKSVIIDAKLSLVAYERYFNGEPGEQRSQALAEHLSSIRNHIRQLGHKEYHKLLGLGSLDYVLMFIPVEPALLLALDQAPELLSESLQRQVMLVSPSTLLIALRTIENLWRYERQSQYAEQIADNAATLYDKFRLFVTDMEHLGRSLTKTQESYQQAMKKLASGRGNLIRQAEKFRHLGVSVKRPLSPELEQQAQEPDLEEILEEGSQKKPLADCV
jgi:DNA recombination protein RmuC